LSNCSLYIGMQTEARRTKSCDGSVKIEKSCNMCIGQNANGAGHANMPALGLDTAR